MKNNVLIILSLVFFVACNSSKQTGKRKTQKSPVNIQIDVKETNGESILFEIKNIHSDALTIFYPNKLWIEKQEGAEWEKLKILECLCDAPCQASADQILIESGESLKQRWNKKESWCGPREKGKIRETIFKQVPAGKYKIVMQYRTKTGANGSYFKEFNIVS